VAQDEPLIPKHGGYRKLKSFQIARVVYDVTMRFCNRYVDRRSRTHDQMAQAARSGVQNIAEGSQASGTSRRMELKLTNVARASLEELRLDYEDFLRQREPPVWDRNDPRRQELIARRPATADDVARWAKEVHERSGLGGQNGRSGLGGQSGQSGRGGQSGLSGQNGLGKESTSSTQSTSSTPSTSSTQSTSSTPSTPSTQSMPSTSSILSTSSISSTPPPPPTYPEIAANAALALIAVSTALLDRQLAAQARAFETEGGFTERLYKKRQAKRRSE